MVPRATKTTWGFLSNSAPAAAGFAKNFSNFHKFGDQISGRFRFFWVPWIETNSSDKSLNPDLPKVFGE